jgi:hypothetical protein
MKRGVLFFLMLSWILTAAGQYNNLSGRENHLPDDFPVPEIVYSDNPAPGYFFLSPAGLWGYFPDATPYLVIMDNYGTPVYFSEQSSAAFDFKIQKDGSITYAYGTRGHWHHVLNDKLEFVKDLKVNGFPNDFHDLVVLDDGHYLMLANEYRIVDMDTVVEGGHEGVTVIGGVIQIQDSEDNVLFHWSTFDHFLITDAADHVDLTDSNSVDYVHINSIDMDSDSTIIMSSKNLNEVTKIRVSDGEIVWRMGGENNMFTFSNDTAVFSAQHDFRRLDDGTYTLFDNNWFFEEEGSRASFFDLDEENYYADLVKQFKSYPDPIESRIMGNVQSLPDGHWVVGWGSGDPNFTEFNADGTKAIEVRYDAVSYRAFKFDWKPTAFTFNMDTADFGGVGLTQPVTKRVVLTNNLQEDIEINYIHRNGTFFDISDELPVQIAAGAEATFHIRFTPDGNEGTFEDLLTFCWDTEQDGLSKRVAAQIPVRAEASVNGGIENELAGKVKVYPNPFKGKIIVEVKPEWQDMEIFINLTNAVGQVVYKNSFKGQSAEISTAGLPEGFYQLQLSSANGRMVRKLVKY